MSKNNPITISWAKGEPKKQNSNFNNKEITTIDKEYLCEGHSKFFGISTTVASTGKEINLKTVRVICKELSFKETLEPFVNSGFFCKYEEDFCYLGLINKNNETLIELINALDKIAPIPYDIKLEIATDLQLDKEALGIDTKEHQAAETNKYARMLGQINRQTNAKLPPVIFRYITSLTTPQDRLSPSEISRAVKHGSGKPILDESKGSFIKKVLDEYLDKKTPHIQERVEDKKKQPKKKGCTIF